MKNEIITTQNQDLITYNEEQIKLIKNMYAKNFTNDELGLMMYMSKQFGLDILSKQLWGVKFSGQPAQIYAGRDGFLEIAHRSGKFDGIESGTTGSKKTGDLKGWCKVYRKDMTHPFCVEVDFDEYSTGKSLWNSKPKTMIQKVAESQCLRKAFSISGIYAPEEMSQWEEENKSKVNINTPVGPKMMEKTQKQGIWKQAQSKGMDLNELHAYTMKTIGTPLESLTFDQAQELTELLMSYEKPVEVEKVEAEILTDQEKEIIGEFGDPKSDYSEVEHE